MEAVSTNYIFLPLITKLVSIYFHFPLLCIKESGRETQTKTMKIIRIANFCATA